MEVRNRFKGLDLIDRVPDELWMEVRDIVQETGTRPSPRKRNAKKQNGYVRSPGEGHGNSLQYSCLGNPMDRGAWWAAVHGVAKGSDTTKQLNNNNENQGALGESTWLSVGIYSTVHSGVLVFL